MPTEPRSSTDQITWNDLCDEVDTDVYLTEYLPAGGTRSFQDWRTTPHVPTHSTRHHPAHADPAHAVRPPGPVTADPAPSATPVLDIELYGPEEAL